jgi:hypothetical protein
LNAEEKDMSKHKQNESKPDAVEHDTTRVAKEEAQATTAIDTLAVGQVVTYHVTDRGVRPAIVTAVNEDGTVNLHVFKDASDHAAHAEPFCATFANVSL